VFVSTEDALDMHKLALNSLQAFYEGFEKEREKYTITVKILGTDWKLIRN
jgi:hypothetical protein